MQRRTSASRIMRHLLWLVLAGAAMAAQAAQGAFVRAAGIDMTVVPYKGGAGQFLAALLGNEYLAGEGLE